MFFQSIFDGLSAFFDFRIIIGVILIGLSPFLFSIIADRIVVAGEKNNKFGLVFLFMMFGAPLIQTIFISGFILYLLPAIMGYGGLASDALISKLAWPICIAGIFSMVFIFSLSFIPVVGSFVSKNTVICIFVQGVFVLKMVFKNVYGLMSSGGNLPSAASPTLINILGYSVIGFVMYVATLRFVEVLLKLIKKHRDPIGHMMEQYGAKPSQNIIIFSVLLAPVFGIIPLLMYGRFVGNAMRALQ